MASDSILTRRLRGLAKVAVLGLGLAVGCAGGLSTALAQEDVTVGGGESLTTGATASDIEATIAGILAEVFGQTAVADDSTAAEESVTTSGDLNVGGNTGGSVVMGGGMGGEISIGEASGGITIGGTESGG